MHGTMKKRRTHPWAAVAAATALNLPLGSIYAFSVFLKPIEQELGISRSALSLVFGLASVCFTAGMNLAPAAYGAASPGVLVALCAGASALGIALSATAHALPALLLGYGVLFGLGGGAAYVILQQGVNMLVHSRKGLVNGYLVGLYPAGAMIAAPLFGWANARFGFRMTLSGLAVVLLVAGALAVALSHHAGTELPRRAGPRATPAAANRAVFVRLWLVFFLAAAAGLTVLSQAAGIIAAYGGATAMALAATTAITGAIACARLSGGWLVDRLPVPFVAAFAHGFAFTGTVLLTLWPEPLVAALALGMVGMGYGFVSGSTAGAIAFYWPPAAYGRIAGRVYIAWCVAAVSLPVLAGHLFDLTHGYATTVLIAGAGNLLGLAVALGLPRRAPAV